MKKIIAILVCLSMLLICFAACSKDETTDDTTSDSIAESVDNGTSDTEDEEDDELTEPSFGDEDEDEGDGKITIDGENIGTPGGSNAGENWSKPY